MNELKVTVKICIMLQKIYISNKCSFDLPIHQSFHKNIKHHRISILWMFSDGSCDTEDSNNAENSALPSHISQ